MRSIGAILVAVVIQAPAAQAQCTCDCNDDGGVAVNEIVTVVDVMLDRLAPESCPPLPREPIRVDRLLLCVASALRGCVEPPATALFAAAPMHPGNPFPSDRLRGDAGDLRIEGRLLRPDLPATAQYDTARELFDRFANELATLSGFSTWAPIRVPFDRPVVAPQTDEPASVVLVPYHDDGTIGPAVPIAVAASALAPGSEYALEIRPRVPLAAKARYLYVVSRRLRDATGSPARPSTALSAALIGTAEPALESWRQELEAGLQAVAAAHDIRPPDIVAIDFFTTQPITDDLVAIKELLVSGALPTPAPEFDDDLFPGLRTGTFAEGTPEFEAILNNPPPENIAAVVVGSFPSFDFRSGPQQPFDPARIAGSTTPAVSHVPFYLTIPKAAAPAAGYPVALFAPGLLNSGRDARIPDLVAPEPMIGISISAVQQGERGDPLTFFNLDHAFATRDNLRQTVADYLQLERMIRAADVPPFDRIDKSRLHYMGGSLGAIIGTLYMGVEPDVRVGMLSVPGGGLGRAMQGPVLRSLVFDAMVERALGLASDDPWYAALEQRLVQALQWAWDPGDPINTAPFVVDPNRRLPGVPPKLILMHQGIGDTFMPNELSDDLARALGLADVSVTRGCADPAGCTGIWRFDPVAYGVGPGLAHFVTNVIPQAAIQAARFLLSDGGEISDASP